MICQRCGKAVTLKDTCIVEFKGTLFSVNVKWIACDKCAHEIYLNCYNHFSSNIVDRCLKVYYAIGEEKKK